VAGAVVSASRQRTEPHVTCCADIPVITQSPYSPDLAPSDLAVPYPENGFRGDELLNHGGYQIEGDSRTPKDYKKSFPPVLTQWQHRLS
jgi:hypothetical protein